MNEDKLQAWRKLCAENSLMVSTDGDERVSESTAAVLLGYSKCTVERWRTTRTGPCAYRLPVGGSRWSYKLSDLVDFYESRSTDNEW